MEKNIDSCPITLGTIPPDIDTRIHQLNLSDSNQKTIREIVQWALAINVNSITPDSIPSIAKGLEIIEILIPLSLDIDTLSAALIYSVTEETPIALEEIENQFGKAIVRLVQDIQLLNSINQLQEKRYRPQQLDNIRKIFLALVKDIRVVVIKLAERLCHLRHIQNQSVDLQKNLSQETLDIFAPLANHLGLQTLKCELEDLAFHYLQPTLYESIASQLTENQKQREQRLQHLLQTIRQALESSNLSAEIYGRAKHIYSIHKKMVEKALSFSQIHDTIAIRILVPQLEDCYSVLDIVHGLFKPVTQEFDDYIVNPKPNGYQSIHTTVMNSDHRYFEIQIRTYEMHNAAEQGAAAHWIYKDGQKPESTYEQKIAWLRQLLKWHKQLIQVDAIPLSREKSLLEDHVYVFTPQNDIIDLVDGATPLDFAYTIHSDLGHRCKGAKVNGTMVPLTYTLKTGDRVSIIAGKENNPSRDWLIPQLGYLKTPLARSKILHWFKRDEQSQIAEVTPIQPSFEATPPLPISSSIVSTKKDIHHKGDITIQGMDNLLWRIAKCCKPIPGDDIVGYITQNQGVTIHQKNCSNLTHLDERHKERVSEVSWNVNTQKAYPLDLELLTHNASKATHDLTALLSNNHIPLIQLNTTHSSTDSYEAKILLTIEVEHISHWNRILNSIAKLPSIDSVRRV